jgi:hypothetical protein
MTISHDDLAQFTGSMNWYSHFTGALYTDGVKFLADNAGAYWLIDSILFRQMERAVRGEPFQVWKLTVNDDRTALLVCEDGNDTQIVSEEIPFTDFPLSEISLYFTNNVLLLPSEY